MANLATITDVADHTFDYIIVGGGTTGLCLASRLTEDAQVTVLVLEAGNSHVKDPLVDTPAGFPQQMGNPAYDWTFKTTPQKHLDNSSVIWNRGKGLGGSSNINYLAWTRPSKVDVDAWERLGNPGWNWEKFLHYLKKVESFHGPSQEIVTRDKLGVDPAWFGQEGPVSIAFSDMASGAENVVRQTLKTQGIDTVTDSVNGESTGTWAAPASVDPVNLTRSSSVTGYYLPNSGRKNLTVIVGAYVNHLQLQDGKGNDPVAATGVEFRHGEKTYRAQVKREVVLCAGSLKSPQVLELSGIGDAAVLEPLGIDVKLHLPGVGANVQEHICHFGISYELREDSDFITWDGLGDPVQRDNHFKLYAEKQRGLMSLTVSGLTFLPIQTISDKGEAIVKAQLERIAKNRDSYSPALREQYDIQAERLRSTSLHECEVITNPVFSGFINKPEPGKRYVSFVTVMTAPWSRGTIHVTSKEPSEHPAMDPHYFEEQVDLDLMVELSKFTRGLAQSEPLKSHIVKEVNPGPTVTTDTEVREYIKHNLNSIWHTTSSLSMLPQEKGGVVDPTLKVYGTKNIRVADLSIVPLQIGVHTQSTAYAVAEQAADIIRGRA